MNPIDNYPNFSPINSFYLPLDSRRKYLSVIDNLSDSYLKFAVESKNKYKETDFFDKKEIIQIFFSLREEVKISLFGLNFYLMKKKQALCQK